MKLGSYSESVYSHSDKKFEFVYLLNTLYLFVQLDCEFFVPPVEAPLFVADLTKPGKIQFTADVCPTTLTVKMWSYRLSEFNWKTGSPNKFRTERVAGDAYSWSLSVRII